MARTDVNREGLTFAEWVCAAGVAVIDDGSVGVKPYTESYRRYEPAPGIPSTVLLVFGTSRPDVVEKRTTMRHYSPVVRKAWKNGEDPTEYRRG